VHGHNGLKSVSDYTTRLGVRCELKTRHPNDMHAAAGMRRRDISTAEEAHICGHPVHPMILFRFKLVYFAFQAAGMKRKETVIKHTGTPQAFQPALVRCNV
jgi:hypothetical protein